MLPQRQVNYAAAAQALLSRLSDVKLCFAKNTTSSSSANRGNDDTFVVSGVRLCRARAGGGDHNGCQSIDFKCRAKDLTTWLDVARALAVVEYWTQGYHDDWNDSRVPVGVLGKAWMRWSKDCGRTFEDVGIDDATARRLRNTDEDGNLVLMLPFLR